MSQCDADADKAPATAEEETKDTPKPETCQEETGPDPCTDPDFGGGDPQEKYRELCRRTTECKAFFKTLTECNERVNSRSKTEEKCIEEVIDYFDCVDHCAAKRFFKLLK